MEGGHVFKYLKILNTDLTNYPVYLKIGSDKIDFYFTGEILETIDQSESRIDFVDSLLFSLPLKEGTKVNNELNRVLDWIAYGYFPIVSTSTITKNCNIQDEDWYYRDSKKVWNINYCRDRLIIRELFLDFIFDLNHTNVFSSDPLYINAKDRLNQNPYFEAISAKADFYYETHEILNVNPGKKKELSELEYNSIQRAKDNWIKVLLKPQSDDLIYIENIDKRKNREDYNNSIEFWFDDIENELNSAITKTYCSKDEKRIFSLWFIKRNCLYSAFSLIINYRINIPKFISSHIISLIFLTFILFAFIVFFTEFSNDDIVKIILGNINLLVVFIAIISAILSGRITKSSLIPFRLIMFDLIVILWSAWLIISNLNFLQKWFILNDRYFNLVFILVLLIITFILILNHQIETWPNSMPNKNFRKALLIFIISIIYTSNIVIIGSTFNTFGILSKNDFLTEFWDEKIMLEKSNTKTERFLRSEQYLEYSEYSLSDIDRLVLDEIERILKKRKLTNKDKSTLLGSMQYVKCLNSGNAFLKYFSIAFLDIKLITISPMLYGQIALTLFLGIFIQLVIQRKPLIT